MATVVLIGPQRLRPTLRDHIRALGVEGRIATITCGWEERETEDAELVAHLSGRAVNLQLWERTEQIFARDPELLAGLRTRKERIHRLAEIYHLRLSHAMQAARDLTHRDDPDEILQPELDSAIDAVRDLDRHHLERVAEIQREFDDRYRPGEREPLAHHRRQVAELIGSSGAVAVAGGHVGVLLNRLRLFNIASLVGLRPVIAWSAGAMALGERIVLFHDFPPQGFDNAHVFEPGIGLYRHLLPFPSARRRLDLADADRVSLLARRFAPLRCVPLDEGDCVHWRDHYEELPAGSRELRGSGAVHQVGAA